MKFNLKNVFLSVGMLVFALGLFGMFSVNKAEANTCLVSGTGAKNWFTASNWSGCGGGFPTTGDTVQIPTNVALTLDSGNASVAAVIFDDPAATSSSLTLGTYTLDVSGAVTLPASTGAGTATVIVGAGRLNAGSVSITGGASGISSMTVSTGRIDTTGNFSLLGASAITKALLTSTNTSTINIGGNFVNTLGTFTNVGTATITGNLTGAGTVVNSTNASLTLNGTTNDVTTLTATAAGNTVTYGGGAQTVKNPTANTYYNLYLAGSGAKTLTGITTLQGLVIQGTAVATTGANLAIAANLIVQTGATLHLADYTFSVGTTTDITGTVDTVTAATGTKTFTGLVTIDSGGVLDLSGQNPVTAFGAGITNNSAILANIGSGASTLIGNIGGTGSITWGGGLTISSGTTTNSNTGTVTVTGTLTLTGAWTQGTGSNLTLLATTATSGAGVLTTTLANTVTYGGGAQTVLLPAAGYYNLTLSGTLAKSFPASTVINQTLTVNSGTTITLLTSSLSTANKLYFGTAYQKKGTWGSATSSSATHKTDTYFTAASAYLITIAEGHTTSSNSNGGGTTTTTCGPSYTLVNGDCVLTAPEVTLPVVTPPVVTPPIVTPPVVTGLCPNGMTFASNCTTIATPQGYAFGLTLVKKGTKGEACKAWQQFFNDKTGSNLVVDGNCGKLTIATAKAWQKSVGLKADGILGALSRGKAK